MEHDHDWINMMNKYNVIQKYVKYVNYTVQGDKITQTIQFIIVTP